MLVHYKIKNMLSISEEDSSTNIGTYQPSKKAATLRTLKIFPSSQRILEEEFEKSLEAMSGVEMLRLVNEVEENIRMQSHQIEHGIDYWQRVLVKLKTFFARKYLAVIGEKFDKKCAS